MGGFKFNNEVLNKSIEIAGGVNQLSKKMGVSYYTVLNWRNGRTLMSTDSCKKLEEALEGAVTKEELMPSYPWDDL